MTTPNAPHKDEPRRSPYSFLRSEIPEMHMRSDAFKAAVTSELLEKGESAGYELLAIIRQERKPFFKPRRFIGYKAALRSYGDFFAEGQGPTPEVAILSALNSPSPFRP